MMSQQTHQPAPPRIDDVSALRARLWDAGFRPIPIFNHDARVTSPGKQPLGNDWHQSALQDPPLCATIPAVAHALNTGLLCNGLRAIDIDVDGVAQANQIRSVALEMFGEAPMRYRDNSPRVLLLYRAAEGEPPKRAIAGPDSQKVEVLGRGQQFVAFGVHGSGADLRWLPEAPGDISLDALTTITETQVTAFLTRAAPIIGAQPPGPVGASAPQSASARGLGADALQVVAALSAIPNSGPADWETWNRIGMATWASTGGGEAGRAAFHAWSGQNDAYDPAATNDRWEHYRTSPPTRIGAGTLFHLARQAPSMADDMPPPMDLPTEAYLDVEAQYDPSFVDPYAIDPPKPTVNGSLPLVYFEDVEPNLDAADFVEGLLIEGAMSVIYGESNCGKTFFATDLGLHIAMGRPWRGREIERGGVVYCALEGSHGIKNRVAAFRLHHGLDGYNLPFAVVPSAINMLDPAADVERLIAAIREAEARMGIKVRFVVIDTLSRAMAGGNENAPDDMGALVSNSDRVRQETGAHVSFVHHSGKDSAKGARGHSLLRAATDTEIEITRAEIDSPSVARVQKQREMEISGEFFFRLETIELGVNRRGKPVTSCVVVATDEGQASGDVSGTPRRLTGHSKRALEVLCDLINDTGQTGHGLPDTVMSAPEKWWRDRFFEKAMPGAEYDTKQKAFRRAADQLIETHTVSMGKGRVWLTKRNNGHETGQNGHSGP